MGRSGFAKGKAGTAVEPWQGRYLSDVKESDGLLLVGPDGKVTGEKVVARHHYGVGTSVWHGLYIPAPTKEGGLRVVHEWRGYDDPTYAANQTTGHFGGGAVYDIYPNNEARILDVLGESGLSVDGLKLACDGLIDFRAMVTRPEDMILGGESLANRTADNFQDPQIRATVKLMIAGFFATSQQTGKTPDTPWIPLTAPGDL
jgi:hypothetical protein